MGKYQRCSNISIFCLSMPNFSFVFGCAEKVEQVHVETIQIVPILCIVDKVARFYLVLLGCEKVREACSLNKRPCRPYSNCKLKDENM